MSLTTFPLAYGCWRVATSDDDTVDLHTTRQALHAAVEAGYTLFDLADIYCHGRSETMFGRVLGENRGWRERLTVATKCGIRFAGEPQARSPYRYDSSYQHIVRSCEASLQRMRIESIDLYQIHRPDWLMDPAEIARAFDHLHRSGKVQSFGVSNFCPSQVELLQAALPQPLLVNQVELSLLQLAPFTDGTIDQCQMSRMSPLAWSPLGGGLLGEGATSLLPSQELYSPAKVLAEVDRLSLQHGTTRSAIALAWLLRHPSGIVPLIGSTQPERIRAAAAAAHVKLTHEEWYHLLTVANGAPLP